MSREFMIDCDDSLAVPVDRVRLQRILHNLLDNAVKYSAPGTKIEIFTQQNGAEVHIGVKDQGIGIPLEKQGKLFELFQRLERKIVKPPAPDWACVCRRLVEAHGGRIWVESQPGEGSTFHFTLPVPGSGSTEQINNDLKLRQSYETVLHIVG